MKEIHVIHNDIMVITKTNWKELLIFLWLFNLIINIFIHNTMWTPIIFMSSDLPLWEVFFATLGSSWFVFMRFCQFTFWCCSRVKSYPTPPLPGLKHTRLPCPSPSPGVCSNSHPLSQWCHPTISSSVIPFKTRHVWGRKVSMVVCFWCSYTFTYIRGYGEIGSDVTVRDLLWLTWDRISWLYRY